MITEDFTGYGAKISVDFENTIPKDQLNALISDFMSKISLDCVEAGVKLIGHIKSISEVKGDGYLACSVTSHDGKVRTDGQLGDANGFDMVLNVMIYGLNIDIVNNIVESRTEDFFAGNGMKVTVELLEGEELEHDHDHEHSHEHDHDHDHADETHDEHHDHHSHIIHIHEEEHHH
jgi:hypothetical protein